MTKMRRRVTMKITTRTFQWRFCTSQPRGSRLVGSLLSIFSPLRTRAPLQSRTPPPASLTATAAKRVRA